jgi:hypothetical protein
MARFMYTKAENKTFQVEQTQMFYAQIRELIETYNIERLLYFKKQMEADLSRIGEDDRLLEKYHFVCKAIDQLTGKKSA